MKNTKGIACKVNKYHVTAIAVKDGAPVSITFDADERNARDAKKFAAEKLGVKEIECLGEKFDPAMHNAVMHVDDEEKGENEIVEVFQKGFKLGDKVIRFAMVKVAN